MSLPQDKQPPKNRAHNMRDSSHPTQGKPQNVTCDWRRGMPSLHPAKGLYKLAQNSLLNCLSAAPSVKSFGSRSRAWALGRFRGGFLRSFRSCGILRGGLDRAAGWLLAHHVQWGCEAGLAGWYCGCFVWLGGCHFVNVEF